MRKIEREEKTIVKYFSKVICGGLLLFALLIASNGGGASVYAAELSDGTYTIDYMIKKPDDESVSMANDYWEKPATIIVSGGAISVRMTINHSEWVTQFKTPSGSSYVEAKVISEDAEKNTRLVQFSLDSLDKPMLSKIHVTVPEIDYDHDYTIRFVYDTDTLKLISEPKASTKPQSSTTPQSSAKPQSNTTPQSSAKPQPTATTQANAKPQSSATPQQSTSTTQPSAAAKGDEKAAEGSNATQTEGGKQTSQPKASAAAQAGQSTAGAEGSSAQSKTGTKDNAASSDDASSNSDNAASSSGDNDKEPDENEALLEQTEDNNEGTEQNNSSSNANSANTEQGNAAADDQQAVELTAALDGAVEENRDTIVAASVEQAPSKKNGVLTIVFLAVLLVASVIVAALYRKRKSKAA